MRKSLVLAVIASSLMATTAASTAQAGGITIAAQDFEGNSLANGIATNAEFTSGTEPGLVFDSGAGLGWSVSYVDTRGAVGSGPVQSNENGDLIGVSRDFAPVADGNGSNQIDPSGNATQYFLVDDADGSLSIVFDQVDATGFENLTLSFDWAVNTDTYENTDSFDVFINATSVFSVSGDALEAGPFLDTFATVNLDVSQFDNSLLSILFQLDNNAGGEDMAFDNLMIMGDRVAVDAPASLALFGLGLVALGVRRRRGLTILS